MNTNFYDNLDLKYIEIGIAMEKIDRMNPGKVPFSIPILTPDLSTDSMKDSKIIQRSKTNIANDNAGNIDISDIKTSNYIYINIPKELCALPSAKYKISGAIKNIHTESANANIGSNGVYHFEDGGNILYVTNGFVQLADLTAYNTYILESVSLELDDEDRYIPAGSKWAICFLGGDICYPAVLARLPE